MTPEPDSLTELWARRWPRCRPIGHELRHSAYDRWIRFHSLPESKRYAESAGEYAELLARHQVVLRELQAVSGCTGSDDLTVITAAWSDTVDRIERDPDLVLAIPAPKPWISVLREREDDGREFWTHLFISRAARGSDELDRLLRLVAGDGTAAVIISDAELNWLYHPYDGGGDVIAASPEHRDGLRKAHAEWLPDNPLGL